eukprot:TRINITY_DN1109_c0_g1_i1.p1 TRINITY_DN1109_c0_g1~~TRINITY_DN1109_c0_g1_i1.p1  ORF type:complete len:412 (+),score=26.99 TRINITY_DN1109_c0_g1_i1:415-1650(+)
MISPAISGTADQLEYLVNAASPSVRQRSSNSPTCDESGIATALHVRSPSPSREIHSLESHHSLGHSNSVTPSGKLPPTSGQTPRVKHLVTAGSGGIPGTPGGGGVGGGGGGGGGGTIFNFTRWDHLSFRSNLVFFLLAQVFVVWIVVSAVVYLQDLALKSSSGGAGGTGQPGSLGGGGGRAGQDPGLLGRLGQHLKKSCPLQPAVCRPPWEYLPEDISHLKGNEAFGSAERQARLPLFFFFAGIEGSGHKFFEQVFRNLPVNFSDIVPFEPDLHLTSHINQTNVHPKDSAKHAECPKLPYARPLKQYAREVAHRLSEAGPGPYVRSRDSFPLGRVRTPLARPDLVNLQQLDGHLFRLKVVVLLRDLANSVRSAARMGYHGGDVGLQVRIVEDSMVYLDWRIAWCIWTPAFS